jgi:hypothetical protein
MSAETPTRNAEPCAVCGSRKHTAGHHEGTSPKGYHDGDTVPMEGPAKYATEVVPVDDDDH